MDKTKNKMNQKPEDVMYEIKVFFETHQRKILKELKKRGIDFSLDNLPVILKTTGFLKRSKTNKESCPCYEGENPRPCHNNMPLEDFSCFLCGCINYESESNIGGCRINSEEGYFIPFPHSPFGKLWDCSMCNYPHKKNVVEKYIRTHLIELKKLYDSI